MTDTRNVHLVAIDASQPGCIVVAMPPRTSLTREQALMFAAWLVTTADAADDPPRAFNPHDFKMCVEQIKESLARDPMSQAAYRDASDGVTLKEPQIFFSRVEARSRAAQLVACVDTSLPYFFARVANVHGAVRDGSALDDALEQGEKIALRDPSRFRITPATPQAALADDSDELSHAVDAVKKSQRFP